MTARVRGESLSQSFMLLCFSAAILLLGFQRQAASKVLSTKGLATNQIKLPHFLGPELPPLGPASLYLPTIEEPSLKSSAHDTSLVIKLSARRVYVYQGNQLQASYPIAIGKATWKTPTGTFEVIEMQRDPTFQNSSTGKVILQSVDNPLGSSWSGFWTNGRNWIGFHGTPQEHLVGQAVAHGCLRMRNQDILALYTQVSIGTPVTVEP